MKVKLYDVIGIKSGMNFYLEAFSELLSQHNIEPEIISNFAANRIKADLPNVFNQSPLVNIVNLALCYLKLLKYVLTIKKGEGIILLVYGQLIDIPALIISLLNKKVVIDIHEVVALDNRSKLLNKFFKFFYKISDSKVISHSARTSDTLKAYVSEQRIIYVPHFHYNIDTKYDERKIGADVSSLFDENNKHFLFFGNIRASKGIYDLLKAVSGLKNGSVTVIIAGQDNENIISNFRLKNSISSQIKTALRLMNDDELKYLFTKSDFILLPYREISQSGVMEMAITFRRPVITSNIPYFIDVLNTYPSFGQYLDTKDPKQFSMIFKHNVQKPFYIREDLYRYFDNDVFFNFIEELRNIIK